MSFQAPITISDAISRISSRRLLLPAIQREFVWEPSKVEWLFDSLLQGYPIGSFLFWEVRDDNTKAQYKYYEFLKKFRERYHTHNPEFNTRGHSDFEAVLDGQQRLTAIYIGITGTYAYKKPRVWWEDSEDALPTRSLYLNIAGPAAIADNETGTKYEFKFLTIQEASNNKEKWFLVGKMLDLIENYDLNTMLKQTGYQDSEYACKALSKLHSVIHIDRVINYYVIKQASMERALNVFVRVNSGGEALSLSDMLMSTAIANWSTRDAKKEINGLVDLIRSKGFFISKDFILKSCLYLYNSDIRYKVSNFTASQVKPFEDNWDGIKDSIAAVFDLVDSFGYNENSLTSKNSLLPIVYWIHHKGIASSIVSSTGMRAERDVIRKWLHTVLLKSVFGSSADTVLAMIRKAFGAGDSGEQHLMPGLDSFPAERIAMILRAQGKDPQVTDEFIESVLMTQYEEKLAFTILALLSPNLDYKNKFAKDHLHPASRFKPAILKDAGFSLEDIAFYTDSRHWNSILNLAHLDENENKSKNAKQLAEWVSTESAHRKCSIESFCADRLLPHQHLIFEDFRNFIERRRDILSQKLKQVL